MKFFEKIFRKPETVDVEKYEMINLEEYEAEIEEEAETYVKVAEVTGVNDLHAVRREIYEGNIVIVDVTYIKHDKFNYERILKELKQVADEVKGDVVGLDDNYIIVTPTGIKIDRNKIRGGR